MHFSFLSLLVEGMGLAKSAATTTACIRLVSCRQRKYSTIVLPLVRDASGQTTWHGSTNQIYGHHKWSSQSDCKLIEALVSYNVLAIDYGKERGIKRV